jgi:segregation and condensation protein B
VTDRVIDLTDRLGPRSAEPSELTEPTAELGAPSLSAAIEALLLIADEPMSAEDLGVALQRPVDEITETVEALQSDYATAGRGFTIRRESGGWRFVTSADCSELVSRYIKDGQSARLSQAALETLAVVAYRQPVSRTRVSAIRAVNVDGVMKTLVTRGLVTEVGHDAESGAVLYATTEYFLQRLGISSLDELPPVADYLPDLSDLDSPELTGEF